MSSHALNPAFFRLLLGFFLLAASLPALAVDEGAAGIVHMLGYIGVDYPATVDHGRVKDAREYIEQEEFAARAVALLKALPEQPEKAELVAQGNELARLITRKADGAQVAALTEQMRTALVRAYRIAVAPRVAPDLARGAKLYADQCASCHGADGRGNGPAAATLEPRPADFHNAARQDQRSVYALFNAITLGVNNTAMQPYGASLGNEERWALALHVANFLATDSDRQQGAALWSQAKFHERFATLAAMTNLSPKQAQEQLGPEGPKLLAYLRSAPRDLVSKESPLAFCERMLEASFVQYGQGKHEQAYATAVSAYLDGFELAETGLRTVNPELKQNAEREMYNFRSLIKSRASVTELAASKERIASMLHEARGLLDGTSLSPAVAFSSSLIILLREGLEAILLLAVVVAFLIKTGRREVLRYIHAGWILALLLGIGTWALATYVVDVSGASREVTEGVTALLASAILLYVGFWLHNKLQAKRWKEFIETKVHGALNNGTLWSIALVAFIAVYREVFETVLFYQTLWLQAGEGGQHMVLMGLVSAAGLLVILSWLIFKFSVRLPLRLFFAINSVLLYLLAVVFAGKGIAALQEAGKLPITNVSFPTIDVLGIYPNLQSLGIQATLIVAAVMFVIVARRRAG